MCIQNNSICLSFSEYFEIPSELLKQHNLIDLSIVYDLPLFIDPFLIFGSPKKEYKELHASIIKYIRFLYQKSVSKNISTGTFNTLFVFREIKQNWLGYSNQGNDGCGGSKKMGKALLKNLKQVFEHKNNQSIHIEEVALLEDGIGPDNISDFITQLIFPFLLETTQNFTIKYIAKNKQKEFRVRNAYFDYKLERWMPKNYILPNFNGDFVLLTPIDILTSENLVLNKKDFLENIENIPERMASNELKSALNKLFYSKLPEKLDTKGNRKENTKEEKIYAAKEALKNEDLVKQYMKVYLAQKESIKDIIIRDVNNKNKKNDILEFCSREIAKLLAKEKVTYNKDCSYKEALDRVLYLKNVIENKDGYRIFHAPGLNLQKEEYLQLLFKLVWHLTIYDVNSEVNNGRGPVDFKISYGSEDETLIEFKLASNKKLKQNLQKQVEIYAAANNDPDIIKVIFCFTPEEEKKVTNILKELGLENKENCIVIDVRADNKPSASNVK